MKPLILITNDDGVLSPGLKAAAEAVENLGELLIVAPRDQQTSMSRAFPKGADIGIIETFTLSVNGRDHKAFGVHGSPAHAVSYGILEIASRKPSLCVSGINYGENLGVGLFPSGTIGAALEADTYGVPGLAVNLEASISMQHSSTYNRLDWDTSMYFTNELAGKILSHGLPYSTALLNVNIPSSATKNTTKRLTRQSRQDYFVFVKPDHRDFSLPYKLKVEVRINESQLEPDSDIKAFIKDRVVSVTPITWNLTAMEHWSVVRQLIEA